MNSPLISQMTVAAHFVEFREPPHAIGLRRRRFPHSDAAMREDPNKVYHRKHVQIIGAHVYKGYKGIIRGTDLKGNADVELNVQGSRIAKVKLIYLALEKR